MTTITSNCFGWTVNISSTTRTASSYEWGPSPPTQLGYHAPRSPWKLAPKNDGLGTKVRTQANVSAVVFVVMGSALEVQKAECVPIWICCNKASPH